MSFLPENYEVPDSGSGYMKFRVGANKFRVLSSAIVGYETWVEEDGKRKPKRYPAGVSIPVEEIGDEPKHFWAFVVWNYDDKKVQILHIIQKSVMKAMRALEVDEDWGDPKQYDLVVTRQGTTKEDTEYQTQPKPKSELDKGIVKFYEDLDINLEALFSGGDPFKDLLTAEDEKNIEDDIPFNN